jgi:NAD(P)-dependent dehydrogenase (short-subunit alcohol dehydrogenase family)
MNDTPENKRIALVTGASRGIGRASAIALAASGCHVLLSARTAGALEEVDDEIRAAGGSASIVKLNLAHGDKVDALGPSLYPRWDRLDVLVAAGGILGRLGPLAHLPNEEWDQVLAVNLTANWRLIRSLDPLLRQAEAGRAVFVSSSSSHSARPFWGLYAATKAALETMVKSYASELSTTQVKANVFWPGAVRTGMRAKAMPGENPDSLPHPRDVVAKLVDMVTPAWTDTRMIYDLEKDQKQPL